MDIGTPLKAGPIRNRALPCFLFMAMAVLVCNSVFCIEKAYAEPKTVAVDVSEGFVSVEVYATYADVAYISGGKAVLETLNDLSSDKIVLTGSTTEYNVTVIGNVANAPAVNITLKDVSIINGGNRDFCPFALRNGANVNLTLEGESTLEGGRGRAGLEVPEGTSITIAGNGELAVSSGGDGAGIGGGELGSAGMITINGGTIHAKSDIGGSETFGAGIGGGSSGDGGTITINGGIIDATSSTSSQGGWGAGIGGGFTADGGTIIINGGIVNASSSSSIDGWGAGIGGGGYSDGGTITINGGIINAVSSTSSYCTGAGIGGGEDGDGGTVTINGGTVYAKGSTTAYDIGPGEDGTGGSITIDGGSVHAANGRLYPQPENSAGAPVHLNVLTLEDPLADAAVASGSIDGVACADIPDAESGVYGIRDVVTDGEGRVRFYLPASFGAGRVGLAVGGASYARSFEREADAVNERMLIRGARTPSIDAHPLPEQTRIIGEAAAPLSVAASTDDGGTLSHQWYRSDTSPVGDALEIGVLGAGPPSSGLEPIPGADGPSYAPPTDVPGTLYYLCEVTNTRDGEPDAGQATAWSNAATVTVTRHVPALSLECADIPYGSAPDPELSGNDGGGAAAFEYKARGADDSAYGADVPQAPGDYAVRARVAETPTHEAAVSPAALFSITQAAPAMSIEAAPAGGAVAGGSVALRARLVRAGRGLAPTGNVEFLVDGAVVATVALADGEASFAWQDVPAGAHALSARYAGDANYGAASALIASYTVIPKKADDPVPGPKPVGKPVAGAKALATTGDGPALPLLALPALALVAMVAAGLYERRRKDDERKK